MKPVTANEMKKIDSFNIEKLGIPRIVLMENAGREVFKAVKDFLAGKIENKKIVIIAGKGGNGGDALVAGRYFLRAGAFTEFYLLYPEEKLSEETFLNFKIIKSLSLKTIILNKKNSINKLRNSLKYADLILDGIFGFGFSGEIKGIEAKIINLINEARQKRPLLKVISIDVPSGLDATTGKPAKPSVKADLTVTLGIPKTGLLKSFSREFVGFIKIADIGIFQKYSVKKFKKRPDFSLKKEIATLLPRREFNIYKNQAGKLLVIAGSKNMTGAAVLTAKAGLRAGAGLVYLAIPKSFQTIIAPKIPEIITFGIDETKEKTFARSGCSQIINLVKKCDALVIGPGITVHPETEQFFFGFLLNWIKNFPQKPFLIDADGLNILSRNLKFLEVLSTEIKRKKANLILTPHLGEFSRLTNKKVSDIEASREETALKFSQKNKVIVVLKGPRTVIAVPTGKIFINSSGTPVLATAGSGDVLTGVIGGLLAQKIQPLDAVRVGVFLHGLAGEIAENKLGKRGIIASDIVENLPEAYNELLNA